MDTQLIKRLEPLVAAVAVPGGTARAIAWSERNAAAGFPAIVLTRVTSGRDYDHEGHDGLAFPRVQFDLYHDDAVALAVLANALIALMETQADVTVGGVTVRFHHGFLVDDQGPMADDLGSAGTDRRALRRMMEWQFFWEIVT